MGQSLLAPGESVTEGFRGGRALVWLGDPRLEMQIRAEFNSHVSKSLSHPVHYFMNSYRALTGS